MKHKERRMGKPKPRFGVGWGMGRKATLIVPRPNKHMEALRFMVGSPQFSPPYSPSPSPLLPVFLLRGICCFMSNEFTE